jgi:peptide-methionine (S)-S-oxide reductase
VALGKKSGRPIRTEVLPLRSFTLAEDYHQKYIFKYHADLFQAFARIYPKQRDLVDSTAAARINAYLGGFGTMGQLLREIDTLGLSPRDQATLLDLVAGRGGR